MSGSNARRFFLWDLLGDSNDEELCVIHDTVRGIGAADTALSLGERVGANYPQDPRIYMSKDSPGIKLASFLGNTENLLIGSGELKAAIEKLCKNDIEFLPFTLYDHRKRIYSRDYFIINPIGTVDCLDMKASEITWDDEDPDEIIEIDEYVLSRKKVQKAPPLFRIDKDPMAYAVDIELVREFKARKLTNIFLEELEIV
ncbi:MAG: hypothetical protein JXB05_24350 [Myxococcaceae bacterium]|nr:hypothetical protein [Myxococcaceae bacterium]